MDRWGRLDAFLMKMADLPGGSAVGQPLLELVGDSRLLVENHGGVTEYDCKRIGIRVRYGQLKVCGRSLELTRMTKQQLLITGRIESIVIERRGE